MFLFAEISRSLLFLKKMLKALQFSIYEIDSTISYQARLMVQQYALSHSIEMGDALIAATAIVHNELLCTSNIKHFSPITNVKLDHYSPIE
jgi:predicted nucleic acid-binding protein